MDGWMGKLRAAAAAENIVETSGLVGGTFTHSISSN